MVSPAGPGRPRWTHLALRVEDLARSIVWYERYTPLRLVHRNADDYGVGAWLADPEDAACPFVLVLAEFRPETDPFAGSPAGTLGPFAHIGIELVTREEVDRVAALAEADGVLALPPTEMPAPIGYICFVEDPDGNTVEFSHGQGTYPTLAAVWGES